MSNPLSPSVARAMPKRILATFHPQSWVNNNAIEIDGAYTFDVTDQILTLGREEALKIFDDQYESDNLWHGHPISIEKPHAGPFWVEVEQAIQDYFEEADDTND